MPSNSTRVSPSESTEYCAICVTSGAQGTIWEGPANIQALELLRLLSPQYRGCELLKSRLHAIANAMPSSLDRLHVTLQKRMQEDGEAIAITLRDEQTAQRFARKLLHRLSQSVAYALLCEAAKAASSSGDLRQAHSAWRYYEQIEPGSFDAEDEVARKGVLELLEDEAIQLAKTAG